MFVPRLYHAAPIKCQDILVFDKEKSHYLITVLRLKQDDPIILFNGENGEYHATLVVDKKQLFAKVLFFSPVQRESSLPIHLGQGLARGDRMDLVVQKATELGVTSITPLFTKQSAVKWESTRGIKRLAHWRNIAMSAAEQCGRTQIPTISSPIPIQDWIHTPFVGTSILFTPSATTSLKTLPSPTAIRLAIGPESGWEEQEVALMTGNQFIPITLGPRILRTETASIATISLIQGIFGDICVPWQSH